MIAIGDNTVILHIRNHKAKMVQIMSSLGIAKIVIRRISYLELLSGQVKTLKWMSGKH